MAQTITGDKAGSGNAKLRGLFTNDGIADLDDTAELLRTEEGYDVRDGKLVRRPVDAEGHAFDLRSYPVTVDKDRIIVDI